MSSPPRIAVIGAGNIGGALLEGLLKGRVASAADLRATVLSSSRAAELSARWGFPVTAGNNLEVSQWADIIVLAVKPSVMPTVLEEIRWGLREDRVLVSVAAAFPISLIEQLSGRATAVFRAMPNIPVVVDEGATGIAYNSRATNAQIESVESLFRAIGAVCYVDEDHLHAVTALSGSGPAYIYMVIEALIAGGLKMGLPHAVSTRLAEQTVLGAAKLVRETGIHPAVLRDHVITPGGVTIAAIHELERHGLRSMLISAVETAATHSRLISEKLKSSFESNNE